MTDNAPELSGQRKITGNEPGLYSYQVWLEAQYQNNYRFNDLINHLVMSSGSTPDRWIEMIANGWSPHEESYAGHLYNQWQLNQAMEGIKATLMDVLGNDLRLYVVLDNLLELFNKFNKHT